MNHVLNVLFQLRPFIDKKNIWTYIEENKVPKSLLLLLVIQFAMIIIDRLGNH